MGLISKLCDVGYTVLVETSTQRLKQVWITGDFFVNPKRLIVDLEAALKDLRIATIKERVLEFFAAREVEMVQLQPQDFVQAIEMALAETRTSTPEALV